MELRYVIPGCSAPGLASDTLKPVGLGLSGPALGIKGGLLRADSLRADTAQEDGAMLCLGSLPSPELFGHSVRRVDQKEINCH